MKKVFWSLIAIFLILPNSVKALTLEDHGITIDFSNSWTAFTRDNLEGNETLEALGITSTYMEAMMIKEKIYIDALKDDLEFFLRIEKNDIIKNLAHYKEKDIKELGEALKEKTGATNYEIIHNNDLVFIRIDYKDYTFYLSEYYTVVNGESYTFTAQKESELSSQEKKEIESLIKTVQIPEKEGFEKEDTKEIPIILIGAIGGAAIGAVVGIVFLIIKNTTKKEKSSV